VWLAPFGCLYYFCNFFCHQVVHHFHLVFRWSWDLNPLPRTMAWIVGPQRSPLDQRASSSITKVYVLVQIPHIVKRSILFGQGNAKHKQCKSNDKRSGIRCEKQNKHQLLRRMASVWTSQIYNTKFFSLFARSCKTLKSLTVHINHVKNTFFEKKKSNLKGEYCQLSKR